MTSGTQRRGPWDREILELAVLVLAAGAAHAVATGGHDAATAVLLCAGAALLVIGAVRLTGRRRSRAPAPEQPTEREAPAVQHLWRLRASVTDTPGRLARLSGALAALGGDIRTMQVHPVAEGAVDEVLLHVPARVEQRDLVAAVEAAGADEVTAVRADVRELDDVPTRTATLASDLVGGRTDLVRALRSLLGAVEVRWQEEADSPQVGELAGDAMCLTDPGGGVLVLHRSGGAFTPAEFARARAMSDLAASCRARLRPVTRDVATSRGVPLTVRPADRADIELVEEFHQRCSTAARSGRYFSPGPGSADGGLRRLLTPALGRCLIALGPDGSVVGMGNLMYDGDAGELALLVRDDWQRRGVGALLAEQLAEQATGLGLSELTAHTHVDNTAIARTLRGAGLKLVGAPEPGEWSWTRALT
ncbi:GNAT family N-acetyltransferase [Saccharopolyspora griseoalba]|uniref:GNAT family N-acetyltransferase n=1 Tax=Saccharopolyspora griseoalba TaxID=1431848 RepID=A0ABW2LM21_9PSEU